MGGVLNDRYLFDNPIAMLFRPGDSQPSKPALAPKTSPISPTKIAFSQQPALQMDYACTSSNPSTSKSQNPRDRHRRRDSQSHNASKHIEHGALAPLKNENPQQQTKTYALQRCR